MFGYVFKWMQNLTFYMILVTAILHVIPNRSYEKYIRFFCGCILIIILITPVVKLFGEQTHLDKEYHNFKYENMEKEMERIAEQVEQLEKSLWEEE